MGEVASTEGLSIKLIRWRYNRKFLINSDVLYEPS